MLFRLFKPPTPPALAALLNSVSRGRPDKEHSLNRCPNQAIITIDGPAGAGKSTLAKALAARLNWNYLDTGAIYRALAVLALDRGLRPEDREEAETLAWVAAPDLTVSSETGGARLFYGSKELTARLRAAEISAAASAIAAWPGVRAALLEIQHRLGRQGHLVAEGRDMGTVVFPGAALKFFLSANSEERARRRWLELKEKGAPSDRHELARIMAQRDRADQDRATAPLKPAPEALIIDSSELGIEQVLAIMEGKARKIFNLKVFS